MREKSASERIREFNEAHGDSLSDNKCGIIRYSDGAMRDTHCYGPLLPPPRDDYLRAKNILRYWELATERSETDFESKKMQFEALAGRRPNYVGFLPNPPASKTETNAILDELMNKVKRCRSALHKARVAVERTMPAHIREPKERRRKESEKRSTVFAETEKYKI